MPPSPKKRHTSSSNRQRNLVGGMVQKFRKAQGFTRDEFAAKIHVAGWDITAEIVKQIERGQREVNDIELRRLAETLRVPVTVLLE